MQNYDMKFSRNSRWKLKLNIPSASFLNESRCAVRPVTSELIWIFDSRLRLFGLVLVAVQLAFLD